MCLTPVGNGPMAEDPLESAPTIDRPSRGRCAGETPMRTFLTVSETAFLLQESEMKIRRRIDRDELRLVADSTDLAGRRKLKVDPESVRERFPEDGAYGLRRLAMQRILVGRLKVPAPSTRWGEPAPLVEICELSLVH